jgi:hypothetical protein
MEAGERFPTILQEILQTQTSKKSASLAIADANLAPQLSHTVPAIFQQECLQRTENLEVML